MLVRLVFHPYHLLQSCTQLGVIKDVRTKSRKIDPVCPQNVRTGPTPLSVRTHHKFRKIRSFLHKKVRRLHLKNSLVLEMSVLGNPLSPDCGRFMDSP